VDRSHLGGHAGVLRRSDARSITGKADESGSGQVGGDDTVQGAPSHKTRHPQRAAAEASENAKRPRLQRRIDFGCEIPFTKIPQLVDEGLRAQDKQFEKGDGGIREHSCAARHCLDACLGDPLCDLMLMYTVTLASCSVTPTVVDERFDVGKKKDDGAFAASLVTRMLWYLEPTEFSWLRGEENGGIILALYAKTFVPPRGMKRLGFA